MSSWQHNSCAFVLKPKASLAISSWSNNSAKFSFHLMDLEIQSENHWLFWWGPSTIAPVSQSWEATHCYTKIHIWA